MSTSGTIGTIGNPIALPLLKLLPGPGSEFGPAASDLAAHVLSHARFDSAANAPLPRETFVSVTVDEAMSDEYVFPLGDTGQSVVLTGYRIAAGFIAERAADEWLELAHKARVAQGLPAAPQADEPPLAPDPAEADQLLDRALECAQRILDPVASQPVASLFEAHYRGGREFLRLSWEGLPEDLVPESRRPLAALASSVESGERREKRDYDPYGLQGTDDYDVDRPLAYREKIGPLLFTMTYRHEYPQVDDERLGTAFAVFHEAGSDIVAAAVELKLVKVPPLTKSADLVYTLDTYSGEMLSLALASTEALGHERLCEIYSTHRVIYISKWEVRKPWRGEGLGVALLHQALERLPADVDGRPNALCVAPEPYQTDMRHFEKLPPVLREELRAPARRLEAHLTNWLERSKLPIAMHFFVPMAKHAGIGSAGENARWIDRIMESEA
ncbi:GNAT family N-acetyltransferase [Caballeronia sp. GAFFF1]|uniref:GNAT family N-acetyltransferase n=1 Tax=Caballeronia sp. GAFFF1 TaxID=2921779 RepID=UPI002028AF17|nr:GNAT family N-acetyltransferase [Caballeronia sp. GAFFF1]